VLAALPGTGGAAAAAGQTFPAASWGPAIFILKSLMTGILPALHLRFTRSDVLTGVNTGRTFI